MPKIGPQYPPETVAEWSKALDDGMAYQHVAEAFGVAKSTVRKYLPGRGWTRKQITEHGRYMKHHNAKMAKATYV
jgi:uncharacterized protein YjcR